MPEPVEIIIRTTAQLGGLEKAEASVRQLSSSVMNFAQTVAPALAGALTVGGVIEWGKSLVEGVDQLDKLSQKVGVGVQALSGLEYAAKKSDVSVQSFETALRMLNYQMVNAARGIELSQRAFEELGLSYTNADGAFKSTEEMLAEVADRFAAMPDGPQKTAEAINLFGRAGQELIPMLDRGSAGLADLRAEAQSLGIEISEKTAAQVTDLKENLVEVEGAAQGLGLTLVSDLAPGFAAVAGQMAKSVADADALKDVFNGVAFIIKDLESGVLVFAAGISMAGKAIGTGLRATLDAGIGDTKIAKQELQDLVNELRQTSLSTSETITKIWSPGAAGATRTAAGGGAPFMDPQTAQKAAAAQAKAARDEAAQELKIDEGQRQIAEAMIEDQYKRGLITTKEYYDKKIGIAETAAKVEEGLIKQQIPAEVTEAQARQFGNEVLDVQLKLQAEKIKLQAQAHEAEQREAKDAQTKADRAAKDAQKLTEENATLELARVKAAEHAATINPLLTQAEQARQLIPLLQEETQAIQEQLNVYERRAADPKLDDAARIEAEKQIVSLKTKEADVQQRIANLQAQTFSGELQRQMTQIASHWENVGMDFAHVTSGTITNAVSGLGNALTSIIVGTRSAGQAFSEFALSMATQFISSILEMILWAEVAIPILTWLGIVSGGSTVATGTAVTTAAMGVASAISSSMGAATGGYISGPGTATSDSIPARLSDGEFVMRSAAVQHYGVHTMHALNSMRFAEGGLARATFSDGGIVSAGGGLNNPSSVNVAASPVHVYFVDDPAKLKNMLATHQGQQIIANAVTRQRTSIGIPS